MAKSEDIINSAQRIYDFICPKPNSVTEMSCVETGHMHQFKSLDEALNWIKNVDMSEFILNKKENNRPNDIPGSLVSKGRRFPSGAGIGHFQQSRAGQDRYQAAQGSG